MGMRAEPYRGMGKRLQISPEWLAGLGILALSTAALIGFAGAALFIACPIAIVALRPLVNIKQLIRYSPLLIFPLYAIISTVWSDAPQRTMRNGLELLLTFAGAIVIARNMRLERMVLFLFFAFLILAMSTLPDVPEVIKTKWPLVSHLGSKNQVGFVGYMLFALAIAMIFDRNHSWVLRLLAVISIPLSLLLALLAQSGGTTSSIFMTLLIFPMFAVVQLVKLPMRITLVLFALLLLAVAGLFMDDIVNAIGEFRTGVLHKDASLTGRTYLWDYAAQLSQKRPYLGIGYSSFWRQGNIEAEGLWRWGGIANRGGFNFHNVLVETRVELGLIGVVILVATSIIIAVAGILTQVVRPKVAMACLLGLVAVLYIRSYVEEGLVAPFSLSTVIWLATMVYSIEVLNLAQGRMRMPRGYLSPRRVRTTRTV
jgi:exopolysaccharide production protein ExoQ